MVAEAATDMPGAPAGGTCQARRVTRDLRPVGDIAPDALARAAAATRLDTLEDVLRFGFAQRPTWDVPEVVVQDEFTHDVVIGFGAGPAPAFLVFDTT